MKEARQEEDPSLLHPEHITHLVALWEREQGTQGRTQGIFKRTGGEEGGRGGRWVGGEIGRGSGGLRTLGLSAHPPPPEASRRDKTGGLGRSEETVTSEKRQRS